MRSELLRGLEIAQSMVFCHSNPTGVRQLVCSVASSQSRVLLSLFSSNKCRDFFFFILYLQEKEEDVCRF